MAPRDRKKKNQQLPKYVYFVNGRYVWRPYLGSKNGKGQFGRDVRLGGPDASVLEIWKAYDKAVNNERRTLRWLINKYLDSQKFKSRTPKTREEYDRYATQLADYPLKSGGLFGEVELEDINKKVIRRYLDAAKHPVAANRRIQFLKSVYSWAIQRLDGVNDNPCVGVDLNEEKPRDRYIEDWEYDLMLVCAVNSPYPYVALMMEIAYLCAQRRNEVAARRVSEITEAGLITHRSKGSMGEITQWSERLRAAVDACVAYNKDAPTPLKPENRYLIHDKYGKPIKKNAFDTAWQRVRDTAMKTGVDGKKLVESFTFHDIKAKAYSDRKRPFAGHKSEKMHAVYMRKLIEIEATK